MAFVPTECASVVAPIDLVPNRVCVNDDAGTASMITWRQDAIANDGVRGLRPTIMAEAPDPMPDLSDEATSFVVDHVPRKGTAQPCSALCADGTARSFLRTDAR
jgi:hypothetical protein